jgi:hypothetical protein
LCKRPFTIPSRRSSRAVRCSEVCFFLVSWASHCQNVAAIPRSEIRFSTRAILSATSRHRSRRRHKPQTIPVGLLLFAKKKLALINTINRAVGRYFSANNGGDSREKIDLMPARVRSDIRLRSNSACDAKTPTWSCQSQRPTTAPPGFGDAAKSQGGLALVSPELFHLFGA